MADEPAAAPAHEGRLVLALIALYAVAVAVYLVLAGRMQLPLIKPDEYTYGHLARSIADGDGLAWRGSPISLRGTLYLYAIAPAWLGDSTTHAYALSKAIGAFLLCLAAVPAWLLARRFVTPGGALLCAAMVVAGSWMTTAGSLLTENLAFPLATAALAAIVLAVQRPTGRWVWIALALSALAGLARVQCFALVAVLPLAALLGAVAPGDGARARLHSARRVLAVAGGLAVVVVLVSLVAPGTLGVYRGYLDLRPALSDVLAAVGHQWVGLVAMAGFVPVLLVLAASVRRQAWRGDLGPLLSVTWAAALVLLAQSAWSITGFGTWHVQRYVEYVLPVLFLSAIAVVQRGLVTRRHLAGATGAVAALLLLAPPIRQVLEERAAWAISVRMDDLLGVSTPVALALAAVITGGLTILLLGGHRDRVVAALLAGALTLVVFAVQDQAGWSWQTRLSRAQRADFPRDLQWIDHAGTGDVARLVTLASSWRWPSTEFFNRDVTQVYGRDAVPAASVLGPLCRWNPGATGVIRFSGPCGAVPRRFLIDDDQVRVRLYDQRAEASSPVAGRVVSVPGRPRVQSLLFIPCGAATPAVEYAGRGRIARAPGRCVPGLESHLWLDAPGTLVLTFRGDAVDHLVTVGSRQYTLAPNAITSIRIPVATGESTTQAAFDWQGPAPRLVGAELRQGAQRTNLL